MKIGDPVRVAPHLERRLAELGAERFALGTVVDVAGGVVSATFMIRFLGSERAVIVQGSAYELRPVVLS